MPMRLRIVMSPTLRGEKRAFSPVVVDDIVETGSVEYGWDAWGDSSLSFFLALLYANRG